MGAAIFGLIAMLALPSAAAALPRKLPPIDQCSIEPSFTKFRKALRDVAEREDGKALIAMFAPDASAGRLGQVDPDDFVPKEEWIILQAILRMGCARSGSERIIPSVSAQLRRYPKEGLKDKILVLEGAKLFEVPLEEESITASLAWDIGTAVGTGGDFWTGIRLDDGREGWVSDDNVYWLDPSNRYEIRFQKRRGKWLITTWWR